MSRTALRSNVLGAAALCVLLVPGGASAATTTVDVSVTMADDPDPYVSDIHGALVVTDEVVNEGTTQANDVVLEHPVPPSLVLDFVDVTTTAGSCVTEDPSGTGEVLIRCSLGDLDPGDAATVTVELAPCGGHDLAIHTASVEADEADSDTADNSASEATVIVGHLASVCI